MYGYIDNISFENLPAEKYWSFPKTYKGDKKAEVKQILLSGNFLSALKNDGHYSRFIKDEDGEMRLQGRTESVNGGYLNKIEWVPQCESFFKSLPAGTCLLGELYFPKQRGSRKVTTILGCLKNKAIERQEKGEKLSFYVFDVWAYNGKSMLNRTMVERVECLKEIEDKFGQNQPNIQFAKYCDGEEAWDKLGEYLSQGLEGVVLYRKDGKPEPGKRTAHKTLKVKMEVETTIDAFLDGNFKRPTRLYGGKEIESWCFWENSKTSERVNKNMYFEYSHGEPWEPVTKPYWHNWASAVSFSVMRDGKPFHIGWISGIPDSLKEEIITKNEVWKGKVAELTAMEIEKISGEYSLRHAKIVNWRPDKSAEDCSFDQIV